MELQQLRYFVAVAEEGSFTGAARRCFVSQPSLSQQVKKLEDELGQPLFDRLTSGVGLTSAGAALFQRARDILMAVDAASRAVHEHDGAGSIRVGILPSIAPYLMPTLLERMAAEMPKAAIEVDEDFRGPLIESLMAGRLDVVIGTLPPQRSELEAETLLQEPLLLALSSRDPLADKKRVAPGDLAGRKLVFLGEASSLGQLARRFFGDNQVHAEVVGRCAQVKTMKVLVAAGLGVAIVPAMAVGKDDAGVVYRRVAGEQPMREVLLMRHRERFRSKTEARFVELLRSVCRDIRVARED
jgi:LysR family hydrogen peroxide-inducible transcriptional activator